MSSTATPPGSDPATVATPSPYGFDNDTPDAAQQLLHLATVLDRHSTEVLVAAGVGAGMRCLDLGAGAGTITAFLADRVGPRGHVDVIDLKPDHIARRDNVTIQAANILDVHLPTDIYDVIHVRLLLLHLPEREQILARLAAALAPGGTLVVSDWDCGNLDLVLDSPDDATTDVLNTFQDHLVGLLEHAGMDPTWARRVNACMRRAGLSEVRTRIHAQSWVGGTGIGLLHHSNSQQKQPELLAAGMTVQDLEALRAAVLDERVVLSDYLMYTTVGIRPTA